SRFQLAGFEASPTGRFWVTPEASQTRKVTTKVTTSRTRANKCSACTRDSHGRIARSRTATASFRRTHPCPATGKTSGPCRGYVIDHVQALKHGGIDAPGNMAWQTTAAREGEGQDRVVSP